MAPVHTLLAFKQGQLPLVHTVVRAAQSCTGYGVLAAIVPLEVVSHVGDALAFVALRFRRRFTTASRRHSQPDIAASTSGFAPSVVALASQRNAVMPSMVREPLVRIHSESPIRSRASGDLPP